MEPLSPVIEPALLGLAMAWWLNLATGEWVRIPAAYTDQDWRVESEKWDGVPRYFGQIDRKEQ